VKKRGMAARPDVTQGSQCRVDGETTDVGKHEPRFDKQGKQSDLKTSRMAQHGAGTFEVN